MKVYLAGKNDCTTVERMIPYRLESFFGLSKGTSRHTMYQDYLLDSGAFSYMNGAKSQNIDWNKYIEEYAEYVRTNGIKNYIDLDIDNIIGLPNVEKLRAYMESLVGWQSIPVWHISRGLNKWYELLEQYNYVAIGGFVTKEIAKSHYGKIAKMTAEAKRKGKRVHGLGFTKTPLMPYFQFYSIDSSAWLSGAIYRLLSIFNGKEVKYIEQKKSVLDRKDIAFHDATEWIKYVQYADKYL